MPKNATVHPVAEITEEEFARLSATKRRVIIRHGLASIIVTADGEFFALSGPSGRHCLAVVGTDRDRLNAHWRHFAADPRNNAPIAETTDA